MKIVFYSTNSNFFDGNNFSIINKPENSEAFNKLSEEHELIFVTQFPGMFLLDLKNNQIGTKNSKIQYEIISQAKEPQEIAEFIAELHPDLAIAFSFWVTPYDWLGINDALIAQKLTELKIQTLCNSVKTQMLCFDKNQTHLFLEKNNFPCANAVYVHHELYWTERNHKEIRTNFYKECVLNQIKTLKYPVIIKDTSGLSSYGMEVVKTFGEAKTFLNSKRNNSDRLVEEFIDGTHYGTEIYGNNGKYFVMPPVLFSVNKYGITSPKQSVKIGPVINQKLKLNELNKMLLDLAGKLQISGVAQVDLIFDGENWFIIEINPRLSGMTQTYAEMYNTTPAELLLENNGITECIQSEQNLTLNIKFPLLSQENLAEFLTFPFIKHICQTEDKLAKQEREKGYCEVIFTGKNKEELKKNLQEIKEKFPQIIEPAFFETAENMINDL